MERIEYKTRDKSGWGDGPWQSEPDKIQWQDAATGMPCLIVRNPVGALCGYVGVAPSHPAFGHSPDEPDVSVHGGLTFAEGCSHGNEAHSICHVPGDGEPDNVWWFGFDCAHAGDLCPGMPTYVKPFGGESYRDVAYVMEQCQRLAEQLKGQS
jgi:hypothetical protein